MFRRLVIVLAVVVVGLLFADTVFKNYAEGRTATALRDGLQLSDTPDVEFGGWPFTLHVVTQSFSSVAVSGEDLRVRGVPVARFELDLHDVDFSISKILSPKHRSITVGSGTGSVALTTSAISGQLSSAGVPFELSIDGDEAKLTSPRLGGTVSAAVSLDENALVFDPPGFDSVSIDLPEVSDRVEYRSVGIAGDEVRARFRVRAGRIDLSTRPT